MINNLKSGVAIASAAAALFAMGATVSTVQAPVAEALTLPAASTAETLKLWVPWLRPV